MMTMMTTTTVMMMFTMMVVVVTQQNHGILSLYKIMRLSRGTKEGGKEYNN